MKQNTFIRLFTDFLKIEKGINDNSISSYIRDLQKFYFYLSSRKPKRNFKTASVKDVLDYLKYISAKGFDSKTQSRYISSLRGFYSFLFQEKYIDYNPCDNIENPKIKKSLPKYLTKEDLKNLLNVAHETNDLRFIAMLEILYATGLRVSELVSLKLSSIIENGEFLLIKGKGNKERIVPLTDIAIISISNWLKLRNQVVTCKNNIWLFPSRGKQQHITRERFAQQLKQTASLAGICRSKVSPHVIRHSFASHMLENGADLKVIQDLLGHSDITTTEIYTHILESKLKEVVFKKHALAKINS